MKQQVHLLIICIVFLLMLNACKSITLSIASIPIQAKQHNADTTITGEKTIAIIEKMDSVTNLFASIKNHFGKGVANTGIYIFKDTSLAFYTATDSTGGFTIPKYKQYLYADDMDDATDKKVTKDFKIAIVASGYRRVEHGVTFFKLRELQDLFTLSKLTSISGNVYLSHDLHPVAKAIVTITNNVTNEVDATITDSTGYFSIVAEHEGHFELTVTHSDYLFPVKEINVVAENDFQSTDIASYPFQLYGSVRDENTADPINNVLVSIQYKDFLTDYYIDNPELHQTTFKNGLFDFSALKEGTYIVTISANGYGTIAREIKVNSQQLKHSCNFYLSKEGSIAGKINYYDATKKIDFTLLNEQKKAEQLKNITINKQGNYLIKGIASGNYSLMVSCNGISFSNSYITVQSGKQSFVPSYSFNQSRNTITGKVLSASTGLPLPDVLIIARSNKFSAYVSTNSSGEYFLYGMNNGNYEMTSLQSGYGSSSISQKVVLNNTDKRNVNFYLKPIN